MGQLYLTFTAVVIPIQLSICMLNKKTRIVTPPTDDLQEETVRKYQLKTGVR